jgi:hypothetical protein
VLSLETQFQLLIDYYKAAAESGGDEVQTALAAMEQLGEALGGPPAKKRKTKQNQKQKQANTLSNQSNQSKSSGRANQPSSTVAGVAAFLEAEGGQAPLSKLGGKYAMNKKQIAQYFDLTPDPNCAQGDQFLVSIRPGMDYSAMEFAASQPQSQQQWQPLFNIDSALDALFRGSSGSNHANRKGGKGGKNRSGGNPGNGNPGVAAGGVAAAKEALRASGGQLPMSQLGGKFGLKKHEIEQHFDITPDPNSVKQYLVSLRAEDENGAESLQ